MNGELVQSLDFSQLVRPAAQLLADVSEFMTLRDGDVLMLGCDCLPNGKTTRCESGRRDHHQLTQPPCTGHFEQHTGGGEQHETRCCEL